MRPNVISLVTEAYCLRPGTDHRLGSETLILRPPFCLTLGLDPNPLTAVQVEDDWFCLMPKQEEPNAHSRAEVHSSSALSSITGTATGS